MKEDINNASKERLIKLLSYSEKHRRHWQSECNYLRADLRVLKQRLLRIAEDIKTKKGNIKGKARIRYYPGGKYHD